MPEVKLPSDLASPKPASSASRLAQLAEKLGSATHESDLDPEQAAELLTAPAGRARTWPGSGDGELVAE